METRTDPQPNRVAIFGTVENADRAVRKLRQAGFTPE